MRERTGSIYRERGRYRVRVTTDAGARESFGSYATLPEAERALAAALDVTESAKPLDVATWIEQWLDARELAREIVDIAGARSLLRNYLAGDPIGEMPLVGLRRPDVVAWVRRMRGRTRTRGRAAGQRLARQTVQNAMNLLRGALAAAVEEGRARANVAFDVRLRRERRTDDVWRYLDPAQQVRLLAACDAYQWPVVAFAVATGLRAGELVSLRLADVADLESTIRFGGPPDQPTKAGKIRRVPHLELAQEAIAAQLRLLAGPPPRRLDGPWPNPHGLLFPGATGTFRSEQHVFPWASWKRLLADAKAPAGFRWHDLRHTCGTSLVSGWWGRKWTLDEVRDFLGHANVATTERYARLAGTALQAAALEANGRPNGRNQLVSQLSATNRLENQSRFRDLNSRPTVYETPAHTSEVEHLGRHASLWRPIAEAILAALGEGDTAALARARAQLVALVVTMAPHELGALAEALFEGATIADWLAREKLPRAWRRSRG